MAIHKDGDMSKTEEISQIQNEQDEDCQKL